MPLIAASTCSHMPFGAGDRARWPATGSNAIELVVPRLAHTQNGVRPAARSAATSRGERVGAHRERLVVGHDAELRRCRCRRCAGPSRCWSAPGPWRRRRGAMVSPSVFTAPPVARQRAARMDARVASLAEPWMTPPPCALVLRNALGQPEQLLHPVHHQRLDLGARRAGDPAHALHAEAGRGELAEDRRVADVGGEVGEEARVLPVGEAGHDDAVEVGEHVGERLGRGGRVLGQHGADVAGLHLAADRVLLDPLQVVGDPVDQGVAVRGGTRRASRACRRYRVRSQAGVPRCLRSAHEPATSTRTASPSTPPRPAGSLRPTCAKGVGGVPLLCVHGWPETKRDLLEGDRAAGRRRVRGDRARPARLRRQRAWAPTGSTTWPATARDLYALVHDVLGHDRVVLLGGDLGGPVVQDLALRHPEWVDRMVLFNSPLPYLKDEMAGIAGTRPAREASRLLPAPGHRPRRAGRRARHARAAPPLHRHVLHQPVLGASRARSSGARARSTSTPSRSPTRPSCGRASAATRARSTRRHAASRRCSARTTHTARSAVRRQRPRDLPGVRPHGGASCSRTTSGPFLLRDCGHFVPWEAPHALGQRHGGVLQRPAGRPPLSEVGRQHRWRPRDAECTVRSSAAAAVVPGFGCVADGIAGARRWRSARR